jgi:hypothetical protein
MRAAAIVRLPAPLTEASAMGKFAASWSLTRQSWRVLVSDKQLMLLPILSTITCLGVMISVALPFVISIDWQNLIESNAGRNKHFEVRLAPLHYVVIFAYYFASFFTITFFNSALVGAAMRKFDGKPASLGEALSIASSRLPQILAWTALASTVGVILQALQDKLGFIGRFIIGLIGMVWTIATFFVVPVLVVEGVGPLDAVKKSVEILRKTWGESLIVNLGIGAATGIIAISSIVILIAGGIMTAALDSAVPIIIAAAVWFVVLVLIILVSTTLKGIVLAATYRYASTGMAPAGFDSATLAQSFRVKQK